MAKVGFNNIKQKDFDWCEASISARFSGTFKSDLLEKSLLSCLKYKLEVGVNKLETHNNDSPDTKWMVR